MTSSSTQEPFYDSSLLAPLKDDYRGLRILAVHAHPDDESSKGAPTMAAYLDRGARVMVATMTGGEAGDVLNQEIEQLAWSRRDLPGLRRQEMAKAQEVLGIEHRWVGFRDSGLPEGDPLPPLPYGSFASLPLEVAAAPLIRLVRDFKPHIILAYDEIGGYPHPDHIMSHRVAMEAYEKAGDPQAYPGTGQPWEVSKMYYDRAFSPERVAAMHAYLLSQGHQSPFADWVAQAAEGDGKGKTPPVSRHQTSTRISSADYFELRDQALRAHASQVPLDSLFFALTPEEQRQIWPFEDYVLAKSRVEVSLPETCLAEGIDYRAA